MFILGTLKLGNLPAPVPPLLFIKAPNEGIAGGAAPEAAGSVVVPKVGSLEAAPAAPAREEALPAAPPSSVPSSSTWARARTTPVCAGASLLLVAAAAAGAEAGAEAVAAAAAAAGGGGGGAGAVSSEGAALAAVAEAAAAAAAALACAAWAPRSASLSAKAAREACSSSPSP